jgi:transposase-like protein
VHSHPNARLGVAGRVCLVDRVLQDHWPVARPAAAFGVSAHTTWKWIRRCRTDGLAGPSTENAGTYRPKLVMEPVMAESRPIIPSPARRATAR